MDVCSEFCSVSNNEGQNASGAVLTFNGDNEFLSNSYPLKLTYNKREYDCVEHFYQAIKYAKIRSESIKSKNH